MIETERPSPATVGSSAPKPAPRDLRRARPLPGGSVEVVALTLLLAGGAALRLRELGSVPSLTDEAREILIGLEILAAERLPLTNVNAYIGALWNYLLAGAFALFGPHAELPRYVALAFGLGTVGATYLLGRRLGGPPVGLLGAALLAASGAHILINSRIAWSHSTTPLFVTLAVWLLLGTGPGGGPRLALAGVACGLALQTHITALALVPPIVVYGVVWRRDWLASRWAWLGLAGFLAAYANVLLFVLLHGPGAMFANASETYASFGLERALASISGEGRATTPLANLGGLLLTFARLVSGAIDIRPTATAYLGDPLVLASLGLLLAGLVSVTRRVSALPLLVLGGWGLLVVFVLKDDGAIPNGRFLMPVVPLALGLVAAGTITLVGRVVRPPTLRGALAGAVCLALAGGALVRLEDRLGDARPSQQDSAVLNRVVEALADARRPGEPVFLDPMLEKLWLDGGGTFRMALRYRVRLLGEPTQDLRERVDDERFEVDTCDTNRAVLERIRIGDGDPTEQLISRRRLPPPGSVAWVVRVAEPREEVRGAVLVVRNRPPLAASGRAVKTCDPGRLI